jgi:N-acetylmuramoyl-L-alanine amidase
MRRTCKQNPVWIYLLFILLFLSCTAALLSLCRALGNGASPTSNLQTPDTAPRPTVYVIDAGHGGEDGGAVGHINGTDVLEKDINLAIAQALASLLRESGASVVLTRETDTLLYDRNVDYQGRKKALDMAARLAIVEKAKQTGDVIFISIHQNTFTSPAYRGLQVYHSANTPASALLAQVIQDTARQQLAPDNDRKIKPGGDIYLLKQLSCPAVLVECGFLSHPEECAALTSEEYQNRVAYAVFCALRAYAAQQLPEN